MFVLTMHIVTDGGGKEWFIDAVIHLASPPAVGHQIVFDVGEEDNVSLAFRVASIHHYIERDQDENFTTILVSDLEVSSDMAEKLVNGISNFLGKRMTGCDIKEVDWYASAVADYSDLSDGKNNVRVDWIKNAANIDDIPLAKDRAIFMAYYAKQWQDPKFKALFLPVPGQPTTS